MVVVWRVTRRTAGIRIVLYSQSRRYKVLLSLTLILTTYGTIKYNAYVMLKLYIEEFADNEVLEKSPQGFLYQASFVFKHHLYSKSSQLLPKIKENLK